jgi:alanine-glyoxylate transaminase/serine-glyoxylate transaminase/serine-pyruvate transaminase
MSIQNPVFIPGPTNIPEALRHAMNASTRDHRAPDFVDLLKPLLADLKPVFGSATAEVFLYPGTGTGGWEAALTNTLSPGDGVLVARYGMFCHKWIDMAQRHGLDVRVIETPWGEGAPAAAFEAALRADTEGRIKAVLVTHNETATGVRSDIAAVRAAMDAAGHGALLMVDGVSSIASMPFEMDAWGVDLAITGSQKGFMLYAGLGIVAASPKALAAMETARLPRTYFDFRDMLATTKTGGFPYTPPVQLLYGLRTALDMLNDEGLEAVYARHARLAEGVCRAVAAWGLKVVAARPELQSETVTAIYVPEGFDSNALVNHAFRAYGVSFGVGLGEMNGRAFRIGHLGMLTDVMVLSGLATIEMAMADLGYPVTLGTGVAAAQAYYRKTAGQALQAAA